MTIRQIMESLKELSRLDALSGMKKVGITPEKAFGVSIPDLRALAKKIEKNHELALELWEIDTRETRILASMIDLPILVTEEQMENWVLDFNYWEICDQVIMNLFEKTPFAYLKAIEWSHREEEYVKRAGFVLMARIAVSDKKAVNEVFESFFPLIIQYARDPRNMVKKGINWALRQIGKRNSTLHESALRVIQKLVELDDKTALWIARDAIRELTDEKILKRIRGLIGKTSKK
jgi:3-methyladenine DNA glycosylase AlkD